jgi:anaerobic magnesium-protoporphyrin IX monomethyl ester cyclase
MTSESNSTSGPSDHGSEIVLVSSSFEEISMCSTSLDRSLEVKCSDSSHYPLGLAYLHSALEAAGISTKTLWLNNYSFAHCEEMVMEEARKEGTKVVGFQMLTMNRVSTYRLIERLHAEHPELHLVVGGIHATILREQILNQYPYLIEVMGESEETLPELVQKLRTGREGMESIDGISFMKDGREVTTKARDLLKDLDLLKFPKHELFMSEGRTSACIITSRGCPFNCSFCCLNNISQRKLRIRSIKNVVDEVSEITTRFPHIKQIWIHDDSFFLDNDRVIQFCDEIIKRGIHTEFVCSGRMKPISPEMIRKMEQANFKKVLLGLESGDEAILRRCHKAINQKDVVEAFEKFKNSKINIFAFLIVGLPGETKDSLMETARFVRKLQRIKYSYFHNIGILSVYPGTEVYEMEKASGVIDDSFWLGDKPSPLFIMEHKEEELMIYKEILLDNISADRILTPKGFGRQIGMWPHIFRYLLANSTLVYPFLRSVAGSSISAMRNEGRY